MEFGYDGKQPAKQKCARRKTDSQTRKSPEPHVFEVFIFHKLQILWVASGPGGLCWEWKTALLWRFLASMGSEADAIFQVFDMAPKALTIPGLHRKYNQSINSTVVIFSPQKMVSVHGHLTCPAL